MSSDSILSYQYSLMNMKKGRRQVVQKNIFQTEQTPPQHYTQQITQIDPPTSHTIRQVESNTQTQAPILTNFETNKEEQTMKIASSIENKEKSNVQIQNKGNEDDKKSRIQMLKQKYLKKNSDNKITIDSKPAESMPAQKKVEQIKNKQLQISKKEPETIEHRKVSQDNKPVIVKEWKNDKNKEELPVKELKTVKSNHIVAAQQTQIKEKQAQSILVSPSALIANKSQIKQPEIVYKVSDNLPKKATKGKVPPPPPPPRIYREKVNNQKQQTIESPYKVQDTATLQEQPTVAWKQPPIAQKQPIVTQKQAPASKIQPTPNNLVNQILAKRLKKAEEVKLQKKQAQQNNINSLGEYQLPPKITAISEHKQPLQLDEEYREQMIKPQPKQLKQLLPQLNIQELIVNWINSPSQVIQQLLPHAEVQNQPTLTYFQSKNNTYSNILNQFIVQFAFHSKVELTEQQKVALHQLGLQYYYSDPKYLTSQFLLVLLKLGQPFLLKYIQFFKEENVQTYYLTILHNKSYFIKQELQNFTSIIIQNRQLTPQEYFYLLLINPNERLLSISVIKQTNTKDIILLLSIIKLVVKENNNLIGMYLRYMNVLIDNIIDQDVGLTEILMKYIQELKVNEKHYQVLKDIKLKLINRIRQVQEPSKKSEEEKRQSGGGFMGYFNKAVDKLKTATTQLTEVINEKDKPTKSVAIKEEEKEEDITYDPVLKRYLINGKVPDDGQGRNNESQPKLQPPPPPPKSVPPKANTPLVPPPPAGKKSRTIVNRYA